MNRNDRSLNVALEIVNGINEILLLSLQSHFRLLRSWNSGSLATRLEFGSDKLFMRLLETNVIKNGIFELRNCTNLYFCLHKCLKTISDFGLANY